MLTNLGFDTIAIYIDRFHSSIEQTLSYFYNLGIQNFLLIFDYDPLTDSITILKSKMKEFKKLHPKPTKLRIKIKYALNLHIYQGSAFNSSVNQIYCNKSNKTLLVSLPLFTNDNYEPIALDINHLLYKKSSFLIFTNFERIIESSNVEFCSKFINNLRIGFCVDLNYLFNPQKDFLFKAILDSNSFIIPTVTQDLANYVGILPSTEYILEKHGNKDYYRFCSQINKASIKIFN